MNTSSKPLLYNRNVAHEMGVMTDLILDIYNQFEKLTWSTNSNYEIGFSAKDKVTKSSIFLGIWFDAWKQYEIPLCITLDYRGSAFIEKFDKLQKLISAKNDPNLTFKIYDDYAIILIDHGYFEYIEDEKALADLFEELASFIGIRLKRVR